MEKEFNLSEKRKKFWEEVLNGFRTIGMREKSKLFRDEIEKQDKEFIKRLKEAAEYAGIRESTDMKKRIDKLVGEDLK